MLSAHDRQLMERRRRELEDELERLADAAEEDELAAARVDDLKLELARISQALYPDDAERRRREGRAEWD